MNEKVKQYTILDKNGEPLKTIDKRNPEEKRVDNIKEANDIMLSIIQNFFKHRRR